MSDMNDGGLLDIEHINEWLTGESGVPGSGPITACEKLTAAPRTTSTGWSATAAPSSCGARPSTSGPTATTPCCERRGCWRPWAGSDVPHPTFYAVCSDMDVIGTAFYLMEPIEGFTPMGDLPGRYGTDPEWRRAIGRGLVEGAAGLERGVQAAERRKQRAGDLQSRGDMHGGGERVVGRLAHVDVIVGVHRRARPALAAQDFDRAIGHHLVDVHVGLRARTGLPDHERKMPGKGAVDHGARGLLDRLRKLRVQKAEALVDPRRGGLDVAEGADDRVRHALRRAADPEILEGPLGLRAPVAVRGDGDLAERISFDAGFGHDAPSCCLRGGACLPRMRRRTQPSALPGSGLRLVAPCGEQGALRPGDQLFPVAHDRAGHAIEGKGDLPALAPVGKGPAAALQEEFAIETVPLEPENAVKDQREHHLVEKQAVPAEHVLRPHRPQRRQGGSHAAREGRLTSLGSCRGQ